MTLAAAYSIAVLVILIGTVALGYRPFVVGRPRFFASAIIAGLFILLGVEAATQYHAWTLSAPQKFLLPPHQPIGYFFTYVGWRLFAPYILSLLVALVMVALARIYNRRHDGAFFYDDEFFMIGLGLFLSGTPGWILYAVSMIAVAAAIIAFRTVFLHHSDKFSLRELWLPVALFDILIYTWGAQLPVLRLMQFAAP
ncbi:MAG: hypothetical protein Q7R85_03995 [bacterium]|nr:hypothetical protein [bacterium]